MAQPRRESNVAVLEAAIVIVALLVAVGFGVGGYFVGRGNSASATRTVTVGVAGAQASQGRQQTQIQQAPAFGADQLNALPTTDWITNGGSLANQRYSPLDQITTSNIDRVKGVWLTHLRKSALAAKYSAESQPLVYQGVVYVPTGEDDVFAVSVATGQILWQYKAHLDQKISVVCCGWESRGVALGDGRVYLGQLDGSVVALDQQTGKVVWKHQVMPWQKGYSITGAPLYYDGRVYTGVSGGEFGIRGRLTALDAKSGKEVWRFYTTEPKSWAGDSWKHGGAPIWQTPSVDPKLGLLYFSTGNANPDNDGSKRAGDNLYAASMVALDAKTGKLRWYYQMVHHDIWDYDAPSPTVLFDATVDGKQVQGIGEPEKTGWLYLLDRRTGKPLLPIPEKHVLQDPHQKTAATQPIPSYAPFVPHVPSRAQYDEIVKAAKSAATRSSTASRPPNVLKARQMYTPYWHDMTVITPGPQGGTNWQPSSYDPDTHMFYVCAQSGASGYSAETQQPAKQKSAVAQDTLGSVLTLTGFGNQVGYFSAIDVTTGKIVWQKRWPESCYSGAVSTKGGLVFIGRNDGRLQAYDAKSGKLVWNWQTGAGANTAPTIFEQDGQEMIVFYAGGNALAASPHGDNLWLLSLSGKLAPAAKPGAGQGVEHAGAQSSKATANARGDAAAGKQVFADNCSTCHGAAGHGGNGGPDLTSIPSAKQYSVVVGQVTNGGAGMPPFKGTLTQKQIADVATYVTKKITNGS